MPIYIINIKIIKKPLRVVFQIIHCIPENHREHSSYNVSRINVYGL